MAQETAKNATPPNVGDPYGQYLAEVETVSRLITGRNLFGVPLYIVPQSRLIPLFGAATYCYADTLPSVDLYLQDLIENWLGRGPCMVR